MNKSITLLLLSILISFASISQNDWRKGYIINNNRDTIYGLIDYRDSRSNSKECFFKKENQGTVSVYQPTDIFGYRFVDGKYFVSRNAADKSNMIDPLQTITQTMLVSAPTVVNTAKVFYPDSVIQTDEFGFKYSKFEYQYDVNGMPTQELYYEFDSLKNNWTLNGKTIKAYNTNQQIINNEAFSWNSTNKMWIMNSKEEFQYDAKKRKTLSLEYSLNSSTNSWYISIQKVYSYPGPGKMSSDTSKIYNLSTSQFYLNSRSECIYSPDNSVATVTYYKYNKTQNTWTILNKKEYHLDQNANDTLTVSYYWDNMTNTFGLSERSHLSYENNRPVKELTEAWNSTENKWEVVSDHIYVINKVGNLTTNEARTWDVANLEWLGAWRYTYDFDPSGNYMIGEKSEFWDYTLKAYVERFKNEYFITSEGRRDSMYSYSLVNNALRINYHNYYYYKSNQSGVVTPTQQLHTIYPNPTRSDFNITGIENNCSVSVYDLKGKVMISKKINANQSIDVSSLPSGVYIVKGFDDLASFHSKLVVE